MSVTNAWFSLALEYGLAIVSLGKAGSADEQLLTGGLTAVESLLGPEIGFEGSEGFVIDHKSSIMERFPVSTNSGGKLFAQYLIQAPKKDDIVPKETKELSRFFIETLAQEVVRSKFWSDIQIAAQILTPYQIYDQILRAYELAHRNIRPRTDELKFKGLLSNKITQSFLDFRFCEILDSLANHEYKGLSEYAAQNKTEILNQYVHDIIARMMQEYPLYFLFTPPKFFRESENFILQELEKVKIDQTQIVINETIEDFFQGNELNLILQQFDIEKLRTNREEVRDILENKVREKLWKKSPLIGVINPSFNTELVFSEIINEKVIDRVFNEYDLAEILGQITFTLLKHNPLMAELTSDVFRNLAIRFPGGLPKILWNVITQLFLIYSAETKKDLKKLPEIMEIPEAHWNTLQTRFNEFKPSPIFALEGSSTEVIQYFQGIQEAISRGFHKFYSKVIWNIEKEELGVFIEKLVSDTHNTFQTLQNTYLTIKFLNFLQSKKFTHINPIRVPLEEKYMLSLKIYPPDLTVSPNFIVWNPEILLKYYEKRAFYEIDKEYNAILDYFKKHGYYIQNLERYIDSAKTREASGWSTLKDLPTLDFSPPPINLFEKQMKSAESNLQQVVSSLKEGVDKINELKDKATNWIRKNDTKSINKFDKEREKVIDIAEKNVMKAKDKFQLVDSPVQDLYSKISGEINSELEKASKELEKIWSKEKLKLVKPEINNGYIEQINMDKIRDVVLKEESRRFKDDKLLGDKNEFLYAFASCYLFNELDENLRKRAINMAIFDPKASKLINKVIESNKNNKDGWESFEFFEKLRDEITDAGNSMISTSSSLVQMIRESYIDKDLPLKIFIEKGEKLGLELGTLHKDFIKWVNDKIDMHPKIILEEQDNDVHVYVHIASRPSVGEVDYLMDAIVLTSFNDQQQDLGLFIETLKMTASTLGELERRKVQRLLDQLGRFLTGS
ncbi:MAG: hypothetical protein ACFFD1_10720 [Candidatus Thorarchaeota archaeon]